MTKLPKYQAINPKDAGHILIHEQTLSHIIINEDAIGQISL
jgi:hypothetical protein